MGVDQVAVSAPPESEQLYVHSDEHTTGSENVSSVEIELANDDGNVIENVRQKLHTIAALTNARALNLLEIIL